MDINEEYTVNENDEIVSVTTGEVEFYFPDNALEYASDLSQAFRDGYAQCFGEWNG